MKSGISVLLCLFLISTAAFGAPDSSPRNFRKDSEKRLVELSKELQQMKSRGANLAKEKKNSFDAVIATLNNRWQSLQFQVSGLRPKPTQLQMKNIRTQIASLEKDLDQAESDFRDRQLGLGELLGF